MESSGDGTASAAIGPETIGETSKQTRQRSQIEFPYTDIGQAEMLVRKLNDQGGGRAEPGQLAAWLNQSPSGGTFRARVSAARLFGFITTSRGSIEITDQGRRLLDASTAPQVRASAFLNVPLFSKMFEKNANHVLPPGPAIERQMLELGVPELQKGRARQVFLKSAKLSQYLDGTSGRFVKPAILVSPPEPTQPKPAQSAPKPDGVEDLGEGSVHPLIQALLAEMPEPGTVWGQSRCVIWLEMLRLSLGMIYENHEELAEIQVSVRHQQ